MNRKKKEWVKAARARQKAARLARRADAEPELEADALAAADGLEQARETVTAAGDLDDDEAREMLVGAARMLHEVIETTYEALRNVPEAWRRDAASALASSKATAHGGGGEVQGDYHKRPRRGADPVVTLMKVGMQAASLLKRIIGKTNPNLGKLRRAA